MYEYRVYEVQSKKLLSNDLPAYSYYYFVLLSLLHKHYTIGKISKIYIYCFIDQLSMLSSVYYSRITCFLPAEAMLNLTF